MMGGKQRMPPYLAIMMLNPCEAVAKDGKSSPDTEDLSSNCSENAPLMSKSPNVPLYDKQILSPSKRVHIKSWTILVIYFLLTVSVNSSWCLFASVSTPIQKYYNVSFIVASFLSLTYPMMFICTGSFVQRLLHTYSPSALLLLGAFLHALGASVRCKGTNRDGFGILLVGQSICGLAAAPTLCLSYSIHILCRNYRTRGFINTFIITTNIIGVAIGYITSPFAIIEIKSMNIVGWEIYRFTLWLAVLSVLILVVVPFTLKGLSLSLSLDEYDPTSRNKAIKGDDFEKHLLSVTLVMSRVNIRDVLKNTHLQLIMNAFGLCFADAYIYMILLNKILHDNAGFNMTAKTGIIGFMSLLLGLVTGMGFRTFCRRYSAAKHVLLFLVCFSAVFDLMFVILHRFKIDGSTVLLLYCISQASSISSLIIYADQVATVKTVPTGASTFVLLLYACIYGLFAGLIGAVVLSVFGETPMLAVTEVASLAAILLTYFFPQPQKHQKRNINENDSLTEDLSVTDALSRRDSLEGNYV